MFYYTAQIFIGGDYLTEDYPFQTTTDLSSVIGKRLVTPNCSLDKEELDGAEPPKTFLEQKVADEFLGEDDDPNDGDYMASDRVLVLKQGIDVPFFTFNDLQDY